MKFTKQQAFEILRSFLTNGGKKTLRMSEKSINAQLETLIPLLATEETELSDFVEKVKPTFSTMNSNAEKDASDFVRNWKNEHPDSNQTDPQDNEPSKKDGTSQSSATSDPTFKALLDRIDALEKENQANKEKNEVANKKKNLVAKMKEKGINDTEWINSFLNEVTISKDIDVEAKAEAFLKIYNKSVAHSGNGTTTPHQAGNGSGNYDPLAEAAKLAKARNEQLNGLRAQLENQPTTQQ